MAFRLLGYGVFTVVFTLLPPRGTPQPCLLVANAKRAILDEALSRPDGLVIARA